MDSQNFSDLRARLAIPRSLGHHRGVALRRWLALILVILAVVVGLRDRLVSDPQVLVFARPVAAGAKLTDADLTSVAVPPALLPDSALQMGDRERAVGHVITAAADQGEFLTASRLIDGDTASELSGPDATMVPISIAEPELTQLLHHGDTVSIITAAGDDDVEPIVVAEGARVVAAGENSTGRAETVLVTLPKEAAEAVAAASLSHPLAVLITGPRAH